MNPTAYAVGYILSPLRGWPQSWRKLRHRGRGRSASSFDAMNGIARTPQPPYYAVIFTSLRTEVDAGYGDTSDRMVELAAQQPGFLGVESARGGDGLGITVSYWDSEESIANWRAQAEHRLAQGRGLAQWYAEFFTRVAKVERSKHFEK
jgi:heme-degrading monooxygenase HmoA